MQYRMLLFSMVALWTVGCSRQGQNRSTIEGSPVAASSGMDLTENGYILQGWVVGVDDSDIQRWPSRIFAIANMIMDDKILSETEAGPDPRQRVWVVPDVAGYRVEVLSHRRLPAAELERVRAVAAKALEEAWTEAQGDSIRRGTERKNN